MGIYAQNDVGTKRIVGNIIFNGFHSGIHIYGSASSSLRNVIVEGNTIFQNGTLAADPNGWGIIVGGNVVADTITVRNNYLYNPTWYYRGSNTNPSWGTYGSTRLTLTNNDSAGYRSIEYTVPPTNSTVSGNRFYGIMNDVAENNVSTTLNTVGSAQPTAPRVYFQSNAYDADRSYVTIFNGDAASAVRIYPPFLAAGDGFELRDVQNYFGPPLLTGTYTTAGINVPMSNATLSQIIGTPPRYPTPTGPAFGSFVLTRTSSAAPSAPLPLAPRVPSMSCARRNREF
jgi:parallel beta-helix repeat protein